MNAAWIYWVAVTGSATASITIPLNPDRQYLVTGGLILTEGDDHARVYIAHVCFRFTPDENVCRIRDGDGDGGLGLHEVLGSDAVSVTIKLKTTGGKHRGEGIVYEL